LDLWGRFATFFGILPYTQLFLLVPARAGPSGSGKSTILRLLVRLWDAERGEVLLNGRDVRALRKDALRSAVAVVPQAS